MQVRLDNLKWWPAPARLIRRFWVSCGDSQSWIHHKPGNSTALRSKEAMPHRHVQDCSQYRLAFITFFTFPRKNGQMVIAWHYALRSTWPTASKRCIAVMSPSSSTGACFSSAQSVLRTTALFLFYFFWCWQQLGWGGLPINHQHIYAALSCSSVRRPHPQVCGEIGIGYCWKTVSLELQTTEQSTSK